MAIKQKTKSLSATGNRLNSTFIQLNVLNGKDISDAKFPRFSDKLANQGHSPFKPTEIEVVPGHDPCHPNRSGGRHHRRSA